MLPNIVEEDFSDNRGLLGVMDGGCLLLVIGRSGVDQGGVGGLGTSP